MDVYQEFGLAGPAFRPHASLAQPLFPSPSHEDALATLVYAVRNRKPAVMVVGGSGFGKTLLAQKAQSATAGERPTLWIHGHGQPQRYLEALLIPTQQPADANGLAPRRIAVRHWLRRPAPGRLPLVIVDDADKLSELHWEDLLAVMTRERPRQIAPPVMIFGLPTLRERLADPSLYRLRRRIFRVCSLRSLTTEQVRDYMAQRIEAVGGSLEQIFDDAAIVQIGRLTHGNPALINQLGENAMVEALGDERRTVVASDVVAGVHAMLGVPEPDGATATLPESDTGAVRLPGFAQDVAGALPDPTHETGDPSGIHSGAFRAAPEVDRRLKGIESRLRNVLDSIQDTTPPVTS